MSKKDKVKAPIKGQKGYQKQGGGNLRFPNRIIKRNQKFWAFPEDIPDVFKDTIIDCANPGKNAVSIAPINARAAIDAEKKEKKKAPKAAEYTIAKRGEVKVKGRWQYDVIGNDGKSVSEEPLSKGEAQTLLDSLS